jgi:hypothetical protein
MKLILTGIAALAIAASVQSAEAAVFISARLG